MTNYYADDEPHTIKIETEGWGGQYIVHIYQDEDEEHLHVSRSEIGDLVEDIVKRARETGEPGWITGPPSTEEN